MPEIREVLDVSGRSPFARWFRSLDDPAAFHVQRALSHIAQGNFSNVKGVGSGVFECKINFGPGYRVYFGKEGEQIVLLVGGGTKKRQQQDIQNAIAVWRQYKMTRDSGSAKIIGKGD